MTDDITNPQMPELNGSDEHVALAGGAVLTFSDEYQQLADLMADRDETDDPTVAEAVTEQALHCAEVARLTIHLLSSLILARDMLPQDAAERADGGYVKPPF